MSSLISKIPPCKAVWTNAMVKKVTSAPSLPERTASQALQSLNQYTLELYARQKAAVRNQLGQNIPVILANQNRLSSRYRNVRRDVEYIPEQYHQLKALAHIPMAVYSVLEQQDTQELDRLRRELEGLFRPYQECSGAAYTH